jgi:FixJ family two-component response regulator
MTAPTETHPTVVLVEDDKALREAVQFALEVEGYAVVACESGEDLLAIALPDPPLCLVVDFHLEGMSGVDALKTLRRRGARHPTIVMTTAPSPFLREWARVSAATLIEKPLLGDVLISAIRALEAPRSEQRI